ncbi:2-amino-4-hydroxy-6-hydroxymethyldihydropteridine diphosphokinase [Flavisolibacter nicotianae]|uniref:2-amino-4-hydroxy-6- hydroxymethyldihydropteridine diphosphokinase n=1 Tax=Flavisolibacter nicotianae TaxID=2364882 RepID=UPI000EAD8C7B|nr:2-amino-4-hydroxy-6-hydroxymethyldihydropteridine diphosphokinase [Flavisolibacter nicotianae]
MNKAYLLIGGNMGNRKAFLAAARTEIGRRCGPIVRQSALYETAAWGVEDQNSFLNQVLVLQTSLSAEALLPIILEIEESLGRKRDARYGPRIIDIDILFFNHAVLCSDTLTIPHPQIQNRRFVLVPMAEIAPGFVHPVLNKTITQLLAECPDRLDVHKIS